MIGTLDEVLDDARLVKTRAVGGHSVILATWLGSHTVNLYTYTREDPDESLTATASISVGDFETGETTREDARDAMIDALTPPHERD